VNFLQTKRTISCLPAIRNFAEEILQIALGVMVICVFLYFLSTTGGYHFPKEPWEWIFSASMIFSFGVQHSLNIYLNRKEMYHSVKNWLLSFLLNFFQIANGVLVLIAIIASTNEGAFEWHMIALFIYISYFLLLDWLVYIADPAGEDKVETAIEFKKFCIKFMVGSDFAALIGLGLLWICLLIFWGDKTMIYSGDTDHSHKLLHMMMSGAVGLHMFVTTLVYSFDRLGISDWLADRIVKEANDKYPAPT